MKIHIDTPQDLAHTTGEISPNATLHEKAVHALRIVLDPELPLNIYDLGLIYNIAIEAHQITLTMTLTAPNCPVAEELPEQARASVEKATSLPTRVNLTFTPKWEKEKLSLEAKLALGLL